MYEHRTSRSIDQLSRLVVEGVVQTKAKGTRLRQFESRGASDFTFFEISTITKVHAVEYIEADANVNFNFFSR